MSVYAHLGERHAGGTQLSICGRTSEITRVEMSLLLYIRTAAALVVYSSYKCKGCYSSSEYRKHKQFVVEIFYMVAHKDIP